MWIPIAKPVDLQRILISAVKEIEETKFGLLEFLILRSGSMLLLPLTSLNRLNCIDSNMKSSEQLQRRFIIILLLAIRNSMKQRKIVTETMGTLQNYLPKFHYRFGWPHNDRNFEKQEKKLDTLKNNELVLHVKWALTAHAAEMNFLNLFLSTMKKEAMQIYLWSQLCHWKILLQQMKKKISGFALDSLAIDIVES